MEKLTPEQEKMLQTMEKSLRLSEIRGAATCLTEVIQIVSSNTNDLITKLTLLGDKYQNEAKELMKEVQSEGAVPSPFVTKV